MSNIIVLQEAKLKKEYLEIVEQQTSDDGDFFNGIDMANGALRTNGEYMLKLIDKRKAKISDAGSKLRDDESFMLEALKYDRFGYLHASNRLKEDDGFTLKAIQLWDPLYDDLVVEALMINAEILDLLSEERKGDFDTVLVAVRTDGSAIRHATVEMQGNYLLALEAVKNNGYVISSLSEEFQATPEIQEASKKNIEHIHRAYGNQGAVVEFGKKSSEKG